MCPPSTAHVEDGNSVIYILLAGLVTGFEAGCYSAAEAKGWPLYSLSNAIKGCILIDAK